MRTATPFGHPLYVMVKPSGAACNMACRYCYYLEKDRLRPQATQVLSDELLERFVCQYIEAQTQSEVLFIWHGGEALLHPLSFYQRAVALQQKYAHGRQIDNCLQTNGLLLTEEWCRFFKANRFMIGISIDGPREMHDYFRKTRSGLPTWQEVMRAVGLLQKHEVEWNALATVNSHNADHPRDFYCFFRDIGCRYLQFTPVVERHTQRADGLRLAPGLTEWADSWMSAAVTDFSVSPLQWGKFLCSVYDEWVAHDVGQVFVQLFDSTLANWAGQPPGVCTLSPTCGHAAMMEACGDVYSCDHFAFPEYRLGNITHQTLTEMLYGEQQAAFARLKQQTLPRQCRECRFLFACHGECPKNRFLLDSYGGRGLNYLCEGYRQFFTHVQADMQFMANEWAAGRPPSNIMRLS